MQRVTGILPALTTDVFGWFLDNLCFCSGSSKRVSRLTHPGVDLPLPSITSFFSLTWHFASSEMILHIQHTEDPVAFTFGH